MAFYRAQALFIFSSREAACYVQGSEALKEMLPQLLTVYVHIYAVSIYHIYTHTYTPQYSETHEENNIGLGYSTILWWKNLGPVITADLL